MQSQTAPEEWIPYNGDYEKTTYDIKLSNGKIVAHCWPNAGMFNQLTNPNKVINGKAVKFIRKCPNPFFR